MTTVLARADRVLPGLLLVACGTAVLTAAVRLTYFTYDEGVYFHQAARWADGDRPYTDFAVPQPPGILLLGRLAILTGTDTGGVRAVAVACGLLILWQTYRLGRRAGGMAAGLAAAGLVATSAEWAYTSVEAATQTPAVALALVGAELALAGRPAAGGAMVGLSTLVRLQPVTLLPGLAAAVLTATDWRTGFLQSAKLGVAAAAVGGLAHGGLAAVPGYWENVVRFQAERPRTDWAERLDTTADAAVSSPAMAVAAAVAGLVAATGRPGRPAAVAGLVTLAVTLAAGNTLFRPYFLLSAPLLAAGAVGWTAGPARPGAWAAVAVGCAATAGGMAGTLRTFDRMEADRRPFIAAIRETPAAVWLTTDGRLPLLAGKRPVGDYHATDPGGLNIRDPARFRRWVVDRLAAADAVAVTEMMGWMLDRPTAAAVAGSGKPLLFETPAGRAWFDALLAPE